MTTTSSPLAALTHLAQGLQSGGQVDPETVKVCCAAAYGIDLVGLLIGASYHPGGIELTRRLADVLALKPRERVLDVASGIGTTAILLAAEREANVLGVDLGDAQVLQSRGRAATAGLADRVRFEIGDAERLPVQDATFDAVVCECAFCTFPDKVTAAAELSRVLRPAGRVGITDVWLNRARLVPELSGLVGRIACLADARPIAELVSLLESTGFRVEHTERHDQALVSTIEQVETRLRALRLAGLPLLRSFDVRRWIGLARQAADMVRRGDAGYVLVSAIKA